jgi:hemoglobin
MKFTKPHDRLTIADSLGKDAIKTVVDQFYDAIQTHPTLQIPFNKVQDWPHHKERIAEFWWAALGGRPAMSYSYDPVGKHFASGFNASLLHDWQTLFLEILNKNISQELAAAWYQRVEMIGANLVRQNDRLITAES